MDKILTLEEVAELLRAHRSTIYRFVRQRRIPAFQVGSDWRFSQESIEKWMRDGQIATSPPPKTTRGPKPRPR